MAKNYGRGAGVANSRQKMGEAQHSQANAFVKSEQAKLAAKGGKAPRLDGRYMDFCSPMINNGAHAQELAKNLTSGLDKDAYPVRQNVDKSQD